MASRLTLVLIVLLLVGCGGGGSQPPAQTPPGDLYVDPLSIINGDGISLGVLKDASGVPQGVRVSWTRVDVVGVQGYYIYRDDVTIPPGNPAGHADKRINSGNIIPQTGSGTQTLSFDDIFTPAIGSTWFYRMTVVNATSDESDFSNEASITIAAHTITSITSTPVGIGDQVTIVGTNFGATRGSDTVHFSEFDGSTDIEAASYVSWAETQIVVTVPYRTADGELGVTIGGVQVLSSPNEVNYREPALTSVIPNEDWVQHNFITINGTDFGPAPGAGGTDSNVTFGGVVAQSGDYNSWTVNEIQVKVPALAVGGTVQVQVEVANNLSNTISFLILPHLDSLNITQGVTGAAVTLTGTNFGAVQGGGSVTFNGITASVTSWNNTTVAVSVPAGAVDGNVVLTRGDTEVTNGIGFDVVPTITGITPDRRVVGQELTVNGSGFGNAQGSSVVTFDGGGGVDGVTYNSWTNGQVKVIVPVGAVSGTVTVSIVDATIGGTDDDEATSATNVTVVLAAPVITNVGQI